MSVEVKEKASLFFPEDTYSVKIGINEEEIAPAMTTWKIKSGTLKAAKSTPRSLDAPKIDTSSLYLTNPKT